MIHPRAALAAIAGLAVCESLGATETSVPLEGDSERNEPKWEFSLSTFTYLAQHARDYLNPNGFKYKDVDLTTYWLAPGSGDAKFVFALTLNF